MPGLTQKNDHLNGGSSAIYSLSAHGFWSQHRDDVSYNQLQKVFISFVAYFGIVATIVDHFSALHLCLTYTE